MQRIIIKKCFLFAVGIVCRVKRFTTGSRPSKVANDARPGRPFETATQEIVQRVEELIRADRWIDSVATALGYSHGVAYSIIHDRLKSREVFARWVPRELKDQEKIKRRGSVLATSLTVCR
jgi:hypothetical protein